MWASLLQKAGQSLRFFVPGGTVALLSLASVIVWPLPFVGSVAPSFGLAAVYYWAIYRPDLLGVLTVFLLGLLNDMVHFLPLGLSAFVYVGVHQLAFSQRRLFVGQTFYMLWFGFLVVETLSLIVHYLILSMTSEQLVTFFPVLMQFLLTVAVFPLVAWVLIRLHRAFLSQG